MRGFSLCRGKKCGGSKGVRGLMLYGLGGVMREENLGGGDVGIFGVVWGVVDEGWDVVVLSACVLP